MDTNAATTNGQPKLVTPETMNKVLDIVANVMMSRSSLIQSMFDPRRNIDDECGYPPMESTGAGTAITPEFYRSLYDREPIAARVVELMPKECWQEPPTVYEDEDPDNVTEFEQAWDDLGKDLRGEQCWYQDEKGSPVWSVLQKADTLSGIGHFGVILLGLDDGLRLDLPAEGVATTDPRGYGPAPRGMPDTGYNLPHPDTAGPHYPGQTIGRGGTGDTTAPTTRPTGSGAYTTGDGPGGNALRYCNLPPRPPGALWYDLTSNQWSVPTQLVTTMPTTTLDQRGMPVFNGLKEAQDVAVDSAEAELVSRGVAVNAIQRGSVAPDPGYRVGDDARTQERWAGMKRDRSRRRKARLQQERRDKARKDKEQKARDKQVQEERESRERQALAGGPLPVPGAPATPPRPAPTVTNASPLDSPWDPGTPRPSPFAPTPEEAAYPSMGVDAQYFGVQLGPSEYPATEPSKTPRKLLFLRTYDQTLVQVVQYEANIRNPRFGQPVMYRITLNDPRDLQAGIGLPIATVRVHWSRVIHLADTHHTAGSSDVFAPPRMRPVLNRLLDLRKLYSASAEGYWKSCFNGLSIETVPQLGGDVKVDEQALKDMIENYQNGLQRWLGLFGLTAKTLAPMVVDPANQINTQLEAICIKVGCPVRVFKGSERGELASSQDDEAWNDRKRERQNNYLTPRVIVPFVDRMVALGVLPVPGKGKGGPQGKAKRHKTAEAWKPEAPAPGEAGGGQPPGPSAEPPGAGPKPFGGGPPKPPKPPGAKPPGLPKPTGGGGGGFGPKPPTTSRWWGPDARGHYRIEDPRTGRTLILNQNGKPIGTETEAGYSIEWPDPEAISPADKAAMALQRVQALGGYISGQVETIMTPMDFLTREMGFTDEEAEAIITNVQGAHEAQDTMTIPPQVGGRAVAAPEGTQDFEDNKTKAAQFEAGMDLKKQAMDKGMSPFGQEATGPHPPLTLPPGKGKGRVPEAEEE